LGKEELTVIGDLGVRRKEVVARGVKRRKSKGERKKKGEKKKRNEKKKERRKERK
jgi:hypothetical protein